MSDDSSAGPAGTTDEEASLVSTSPFFSRLPEGLLLDKRVGDGAVRLWAALDRTAQRDRIWPGRERLGEQLGVSPRQIDRRVKELIDAGWLSVRRRGLGKTNHYTLHDRQAVTDSPSMSTPKWTDTSTPEWTDTSTNRESKKNESKEESSASAEVRPEIASLCEHLADRIETYRGKRPRVTAKWYKDMRLLVDRGDPSWAKAEEIGTAKVAALVDYLFLHCEQSSSGFCWADQVQSPGGLRTKWEKIRVWANHHHDQRQSSTKQGEDWMKRSGS